MDTAYYALILYKITAHLDHMDTMKKCQWTLFLAIALTSLQVFPTIPASSFPSSSFLVFCFYVVLGGFNSKLISLWHENASSVCLIHFHFYSLICTAMCFFCPRLNNSSFEIMLKQDILKISQRYIFSNVGMLLVILLVTFHVSHPYLTLLLKDLNLVAVYIFLAYHNK